MPEENSKNQSKSEREAILKLIKTPLSFFVLIAMIIEAILGALAIKSSGEIQKISLWGVIIVVVLLILVVTVLTIWKPDYLLGRFSGDQAISAFCKRITGEWWEKVIPFKSTALSIFRVRFDLLTNTVHMNGISYDIEGDMVAEWWTEASCISLTDSKVFYYWKGRHILDPGVPFEGFGEITFDDNLKEIKKGRGLFSDTRLTDISSTQWKSTILRRCSGDEERIMSGTDVALIKECVKRVFESLG
jgi:hypothetical protein